jgi:nucleoside-diphosphate-sugar epimerase
VCCRCDYLGMMAIKQVVVTGSEGKAGRFVAEHLEEVGYSVLRVDIAAALDPSDHGLRRVDLTDLGQTMEVLQGADAVVHLAAIPAPMMITDAETFRNNTLSTYNVFSAATAMGLQRVVWASSETALGLPFDREPDYAPVDEQHTYPESSYALSKVVSEEMARQWARWSAMPIVGLRLSNIMAPPDYARFPEYQDDPELRKWNLWGYVDARDVAQSCRRSLEAELSGAHHYVIAAADTVMNRSSAELMKEVFPNVPIKKKLETYETLLSIDRARSELGYEPEYSWREA